MIEFSGHYSDKICLNLAKKKNIYAGKIFLLFSIIGGGGATLISSLMHNKIQYEFLCLFIILLVLSIFIFVSPPKARVLRFNEWHSIVLDNDVICKTIYHGEQIVECRAIKKIKKVIDYGDCYYMIFDFFNDPSATWVCQKDLMVKGSVEEFERLFMGKIVRKY